eukprot:NODE_197_length_3422_cov_8.090137.p1 GENE.NODE_197_length_3422_cov_8.090137~~NODE_197_length_3422_cov_8.090137.p1  ORF type:complete len:388 (+),score=106.98 NODE_197_length_3422_cov_8.090137:2119-3282(+)
MDMGKFDEAERPMLEAASLNPLDAGIRSELKKLSEILRKARKQERKVEKKTYAGMWAKLEGFAVPTGERPLLWPEGSMAAPITTLGEDVIANLADEVSSNLAGKGEGGLTISILQVLRHTVERQFGVGGGKKLARIVPFLERFMRGETQQKYEPGRGQRLVSAYIADMLPDRPFLDVGWCELLAEKSNGILEELKEHIEGELWQEPPMWGLPHKEIMREGGARKWREVPLVRHGVWVADARFNKLRALLGTLEDMNPHWISFVKLPSRSTERFHHDSTGVLLAAHLGLQLEEGGRNVLKVGDASQEYRVGKVLVWNHTYPHTASNGSRHDTLLLACYFYHPELCDEERFALMLLFALLEALQQNNTYQHSKIGGVGMVRSMKSRGIL